MARPDFTVEFLRPGDLTPHPHNFRRHPDLQRRALAASIEEHGYLSAPIVNKRSGHVLDGHARIELAVEQREETIPVRVIDVPEDQERRILRVFDAVGALAEEDTEALDRLIAEINDADLERLLGELEEDAGTGGSSGDGEAARLTLAERFGIPPFSVLDARQGYWQERKRAWIALGIESELGRGDVMPSGASSVDAGSSEWSGYRGPARANASPGGSPRDAASLGKDGKTVRGYGKGRGLARTFGQDLMRGEHVVGEKSGGHNSPRKAPELERYPVENGVREETQVSGTSIFDPVLCELAYRWFCPDGGQVLDPFAGGSVRGIVAATLGRSYIGVDLRPEQLAANQVQADRLGLSPHWIEGDSRELPALFAEPVDFIFSCPPYADLEVYSDDPRDLSTMSYADFLAAYRQIIAASVALLKENRFACFVVGDVRDPKGFYRNFVADTVAAFQDAGMRLYNDAVLVTAVGSLPIRVGKQFGSNRKLGRTHQNVEIFYKGDPARIRDIAADCQFGKLEELADDSAPV
jgi:hypothetical protein